MSGPRKRVSSTPRLPVSSFLTYAGLPEAELAALNSNTLSRLRSASLVVTCYAKVDDVSANNVNVTCYTTIPSKTYTKGRSLHLTNAMFFSISLPGLLFFMYSETISYKVYL